MRKSFILHLDSLSILDDLTDQQAGQLLKAFYNFNCGNAVDIDVALKLLFVSFRNQFKRDSEAYQKTCNINAANGSSGGKRKVANAAERKRQLAKLAYNDNDSDSKNDSKNENKTNDFLLFWDLYEKKINRPACEKRWSRLEVQEKQNIMAGLPVWLAAITDRKFQPHPLTFLNQRRWEDEIKPKMKSETTYVATQNNPW